MPLLSNHGNQILDLPEELTSADDTLISDLLDDNKEIVVQNKTTNEDDDDEDDEEQDEDQPVTLRMLYSSVVKVENQSLNWVLTNNFMSFFFFNKMPPELKGLLICQLFGWLAYFCSTLFFTDFMGAVKNF